MAKLASFIAVHHYRLLNALLRLVAHTLYHRISNVSTLRKVLIVRKGTLGDHLCALPAIDQLKEKFSNASFDLLTYTNNQPSISIQSLVDDGYFNHIYDLGKGSPEQFRLLLKSRHYDAVIEIPQNLDTFYTQLRNMVFFRLAGIKVGAGWTVSNTLFLKKHQIAAIVFENEQERIRKILLSYGIHTEIRLPEHVHMDESLKLPFAPHSYIVIATGAKHQSKRWPLGYYKMLAFELTQKRINVVLTGNAFDFSQTADWVEGDYLVNLCGKTTIPQSAFLLKNARLTICNDSGPMHLSYSVGTPVVAIFSARGYKGKWFPPADGKNTVLGNFNVPCAVCLLGDCNNHICMERISVQDVLRNVDEVLSLTHS
jgi:ADP-heptose:LPS heptosyltransferase